MAAKNWDFVPGGSKRCFYCDQVGHYGGCAGYRATISDCLAWLEALASGRVRWGDEWPIL